MLPLKLDYQIGPLIFYHVTGRKVSSLSLSFRTPIQLAMGAYRALIERYAVYYFVTLIMGAIIFVEGIQILTKQLNPVVLNTSFTIKFRQTLKIYRSAQILLSQANLAIEQFLYGLASLGITFTGWCAYGTLTERMKNELPLLTYMTCPVIVSVALFVDFVLMYFASIPNINATRFQIT